MYKNYKKYIFIVIIFISMMLISYNDFESYGKERLKRFNKVTFYNGPTDYVAHGEKAEEGMCAADNFGSEKVLYIKTRKKGEGSYANGRYFWLGDTGPGSDNIIDVYVDTDNDSELEADPYGAYTKSKVYLIEENVSWEEFKKKYANKKGGEELNFMTFPERKLGYKDNEKKVEWLSIDRIIELAESFVKKDNKENVIDQKELAKTVKSLYYILLAVAIALSVIIGLYLAVKWMLQSTAEGEAKIKESFVAYLIGCTVSFSAFGIWALVMKILNAM